jgi:beta-glucanase (GH16 family)
VAVAGDGHGKNSYANAQASRGQLTVKAGVMNHPFWGRRKWIKQLVLACVIVALATVLVTALVIVTSGQARGMAPPSGYSAGQLVFDDQFPGTALNSAYWNTFMTGQSDQVWNSDGLPAGDSAPGTHFHQTYFSPSQVTVNDGLTLTMVPDTKYASLGYEYRSGVVTTGHKFILRSGYVQIKAKMSDASQGGWPAIWFIDPSSGGGSQEIDLQEGGFTAKGAGLPRGTPENNVFVSTYHTPSGSQSDFSYVTPKPMNAGFDIYGMQYIPGRSIKTYFNGRLVGSWTQNISTTPYEIIIWNTQAAGNTSGYHTTGESPDPSDLSVAEVQVYALSQ